MPDSITQELSSAYAQLAELQMKIDEDNLILFILQSHTCDGCERSDGYNLAIEIIAARRGELDRELRKVKKQIREIESMWRG